MGTQRRGAVKAHTRVVNGRRQRVQAHKRKLGPARARTNARQARRALKLKRPGVAAVCATAAVAELGGWLALKGTGVALVTVGIALLGAGVAARRASATPRPVHRSPGTVRPAPQRKLSFYEQGRRAAAADNQRSNGYDHSVPTPKFKGEDDPDAAEWNRGYEDGMN